MLPPDVECSGDSRFTDEVNGRTPQSVIPALKAVCGRCRHQAECLEDALKDAVQYLFRAGMTAPERTRLKRTRKGKTAVTIEFIIREDITPDA